MRRRYTAGVYLTATLLCVVACVSTVVHAAPVLFVEDPAAFVHEEHLEILLSRCTDDNQCDRDNYCVANVCHPKAVRDPPHQRVFNSATAWRYSFALSALLITIVAFALMTVAPVRQMDGWIQLLALAGWFVIVLFFAYLEKRDLSAVMLPRVGDLHGDGDECAIVGQGVCEPYLCDVRHGRCLTGCEDSDMCIPPYTCEEGTCVYKPTSKGTAHKPRTERAQSWRDRFANVFGDDDVSSVKFTSYHWMWLLVPTIVMCIPIVFVGAELWRERLYYSPTNNCYSILWMTAFTLVLVSAAKFGLPDLFLRPLVSKDVLDSRPHVVSDGDGGRVVQMPGGASERGGVDDGGEGKGGAADSDSQLTKIPCKGPHACAPFECDHEWGGCFTSCASDAECVSDLVCDSETGKCVKEASGLAGPYLSFWQRVAVCGISLVVLPLFAFIFSPRRSECVAVMFSLCVWGVVVLLVWLYASGGHEPFPLGDGNTCGDTTATSCFPYLCDKRPGQCFTYCSHSLLPCADSAKCIRGECVASKRFHTRTWAAFSVKWIVRPLVLVAGCGAIIFAFFNFRRLPHKAIAIAVIVVGGVMVLWFLWGVVSYFFFSSPTPAGTGAECVAGLDPVCGHYLCDPREGKCLESCTQHYHCGYGRSCVGGKCGIESGYMVFAPLRYSLYRTAIDVVLVFVGFFVCAKIFFHFSWRAHNVTYGMGLPGAGISAGVGVVCWVVFRIGLACTTWYMRGRRAGRELVGAGDACAYPADAACGVYACDTFNNACFTSCDDSYDCMTGHYCDSASGTCVPEDLPSIVAHWHTLLMAACAILTAFTLWPFVYAGWRRRQNRLEREAYERQEALLKEQEENRERIRAEHPVFLDVDPARPFSKDISLPSPAVWVAAGSTPTEPKIFGGFPAVAVGDLGEGNVDPAGANLFVGDDVQPGDTTPLPKPIVIVPGTRTDVREVRSTAPDCAVCYAAPATVRMVGRNCTHGFCDECAEHSLESILESGQFPARCPGCRAAETRDGDGGGDDNGASYIPSDVIERLVGRGVLTVDFGRTFIQQQILKAFKPNEVINCPVCTMLNVTDGWDGKELPARDPYKVACAECETEFCGRCNCLYTMHAGLSCDDHAKKQIGIDEIQAMRLINTTSKRCPVCNMGISHYRNHACHHIRPGTGCPNCGHHFCIVCLEDYPCSKNGHSLFCDDNCDCPLCPDCKPGVRCPHCDGCPSCR